MYPRVPQICQVRFAPSLFLNSRASGSAVETCVSLLRVCPRKSLLPPLHLCHPHRLCARTTPARPARGSSNRPPKSVRRTRGSRRARNQALAEQHFGVPTRTGAPGFCRTRSETTKPHAGAGRQTSDTRADSLSVLATVTPPASLSAAVIPSHHIASSSCGPFQRGLD